MPARPKRRETNSEKKKEEEEKETKSPLAISLSGTSASLTATAASARSPRTNNLNYHSPKQNDNSVYYTAPNMSSPTLPSLDLNPPSSNSKPTIAVTPRTNQRKPQAKTGRGDGGGAFKRTGDTRMRVDRLRPDKTKDISQVVQQGDFMHKGRAAPTTPRRTRIDMQFDMKNKDKMRDDLLPDHEFIKRIFYTQANRSNGAIGKEQFEEACCVIFGRVNGIDIEKIPPVADDTHDLVMTKLSKAELKKQTLDTFHVSLVACGYMLLMKPLFAIRKFGTRREFAHLADNLDISDANAEEALAELDPKETGKFSLLDFVWWAANRTVKGDFVLDMLPMRALSIVAPKKKDPHEHEEEETHAGRCALSPRLAEVQAAKERQKQYQKNQKSAFDDRSPSSPSSAVPTLPQLSPKQQKHEDDASATTSSSGNDSLASARQQEQQQQQQQQQSEQQQRKRRTHQRLRRHLDEKHTPPEPVVVAFGGSTPRRQSIIGKDEERGVNNTPSSTSSSRNSSRNNNSGVNLLNNSNNNNNENSSNNNNSTPGSSRTRHVRRNFRTAGGGTPRVVASSSPIVAASAAVEEASKLQQQNQEQQQDRLDQHQQGEEAQEAAPLEPVHTLNEFERSGEHQPLLNENSSQVNNNNLVEKNNNNSSHNVLPVASSSSSSSSAPTTTSALISSTASSSSSSSSSSSAPSTSIRHEDSVTASSAEVAQRDETARSGAQASMYDHQQLLIDQMETEANELLEAKNYLRLGSKKPARKQVGHAKPQATSGRYKTVGKLQEIL